MSRIVILFISIVWASLVFVSWDEPQAGVGTTTATAAESAPAGTRS
jgi:hypothetical protein